MTIGRIRPWLVRSCCGVALLASAHYLIWRALHTFNAHAPVLSALLYGAECFGLVMFGLHVLLTWDTRVLERRLGLPDDQTLADAVLPPPGQPTVDVFIPTYDESVTLLRNTALAAREMRGPHRTWVLDDGRRPEVREMCAELGVAYLTRESNEHAKAGNLNAALAATDGELVVVLDADFIPLPGLLERTLPHFADERLAFVQLPQAFYNVDSIQHVDRDVRAGWHEQSLFYDVIQPGKNRWNSAFWCGSPAVLRRSALESVGGAATGTITEDILTSMRMHARGWRSLYHNEVLAVGVAPGDLHAFRTQRLRWAQGAMQILRSRENPLLTPGLTLAQRLNYLASTITYFQAAQLAVFAAMPALMLVTGEPPIAGIGGAFFAHFTPYMVATALATKLTAGSRQRMTWDQYFAFLRMFTFLRALPVLVTGGRRLAFRVTPKAPTASSQRRGLYPHIVVGALNLAAVAALLAVPLREGFDTATRIAAAVCAFLMAGLYATAVVLLWRRVYRRHHYRVRLALPASVEHDGEHLDGQTEDLSFRGASIVLPGGLPVGGRLAVRIYDSAEIGLDATVVSCRQSGDGAYRAGLQFEQLAAEDEQQLLFVLLEAATAGARRPHPRSGVAIQHHAVPSPAAAA